MDENAKYYRYNKVTIPKYLCIGTESKRIIIHNIHSVTCVIRR